MENNIVEFKEGTYYLYRHIRLDTNTPFYIGIGTVFKKKVNNKTHDRTFYQRAFCSLSYKRNSLWNKVTNKTNYKVEVLIESDNKQFIIEKEKEFIKLYGRIDLKTGTLVNFLNGGEGTSDWSEERKLKSSIRLKEKHRLKEINTIKKHTLESIEKIRYQRGDCKPILQYDLEGNFIKRFRSIGEASRCLNADSSSISKVCRKIKKTTKNYIFNYE